MHNIPNIFRSDGEFRDVLRSRAERLLEEKRRIQEELRRFGSELATLDEFIADLNPLLERYDLPAIELAEQAPTKHGESTSATWPVGKIGNRSEDMPSRRESFRTAKLDDAIRIVLVKAGREMHASEIAQQIFDVAEHRDIERVRRTLNSHLSHGAADGKWDRTERQAFYRAKAMDNIKSENEQPEALSAGV